MPSSFEEIAPAGYAWPVTASDGTDLVKHTRAIYIGGDGNVACEVYDPATQKVAPVTFIGLVAGTVLPVRTKRILSTGTTATNIVALA
ncbi:hypothetical protein [Agrobacterium radiobacter]|uniref:spike base protein, RCAP_Rcc01079 family n=1 Tax=Agrobacterium radiobacter TaxID=362 RepID=UPI0016056F6C|nr:hypothetical protein [Agrobacterium radiobacter]MBB4407086.1 hypothetical protein [Agrobacterium radiobacter]MBB4452710.1 hypothetical protein [Agrobacterium radiobacter]